MRIEYTPEAAGDLDHISQHYTERAGTEVAQQLVRRIVSTLERLIARNPHAGRQRRELGLETRSFPVLPYVIFYRTAGKKVVVQRILHGHRDIHPPLVSLLLAV
jgi:plasmid stabilization system protein ParE